jgi:hypothetical protein
MLGITQNPPKFVKNFLTNGNIQSATKDFIQAVKGNTFPADKHSYSLVMIDKIMSTNKMNIFKQTNLFYFTY